MTEGCPDQSFNPKPLASVEEPPMKPIIILPPDVMSADDISELRGNDLCVVIATDPAKVRFLDPIPTASSRSQIEDACIRLSRKILHGHWTGKFNTESLSKTQIRSLYLDSLLSGSPLDPAGTKEQQEEAIISAARRDELCAIGREEARAERAAKKAAKTTKKPVGSTPTKTE
jgi:hypothetical protein